MKLKDLKDIPSIFFMLLVIAPCKAIYEGWKLYQFKKHVVSKIKKSAYKSGNTDAGGQNT